MLTQHTVPFDLGVTCFAPQQGETLPLLRRDAFHCSYGDVGSRRQILSTPSQTGSSPALNPHFPSHSVPAPIVSSAPQQL